MSDTLHYGSYDGSIVYDAEDQIFHGKIIGIRDFVLYDGETREILEDNFRKAVGAYLRFSEEDGKQPEVPFAAMHFSFPSDLHRRASLFAEEHDLDLSAVVQQALSEFLAHAE